MGELAQRLDAEVRRATDALIALHAVGTRRGEVLQRMGAQLAVDKRPTRQGERTGRGGVGRARRTRRGPRGAASPSARALLAGCSAGGARPRERLQLARGTDATTVRWSAEFMTDGHRAVLRYLAVAHFGRGRATSWPANTRRWPHWWKRRWPSTVRESRSCGPAPPRRSADVLSARLRAPLEAITEECCGGCIRPLAPATVARLDVLVGRFLEEPDHHGAEQDGGSDFHDLSCLSANVRPFERPPSCLLHRRNSLTQ